MPQGDVLVRFSSLTWTLLIVVVIGGALLLGSWLEKRKGIGTLRGRLLAAGAVLAVPALFFLTTSQIGGQPWTRKEAREWLYEREYTKRNGSRCYTQDWPSGVAELRGMVISRDAPVKGPFIACRITRPSGRGPYDLKVGSVVTFTGPPS